jgi:phosphatidylglycerol:prolipoprotein diacylglycerol transferase
MYPELFEIPFIRWPVPTYGVMIVIAFLCAVFVIRRLSRDMTPDPQYVYNGAMYALIAGVLGSRLFYVAHHFEQFRGRLLSVFAVWQGGLEVLGGAILAIAAIFFYLRHHKLPVRRFLDVVAIGLMLALGLGRNRVLSQRGLLRQTYRCGVGGAFPLRVGCLSQPGAPKLEEEAHRGTTGVACGVF